MDSRKNLGNNKQAIAEYNELLKMKNLPTEMAQAVHIRLVKLHEKNLDKSLFTFSKSSYVQKFIISPGKKGVDLDPESNNATTLERLMERIRNKYQTPSILSFKIGSIGNSYRFNQNFTYDTNVTAQAESASDFRDSGYSNSQFLYKHFFGSKKGFTHNPELRFDYRHHFERNVSAIISNDNYIISPSFRNSFEHQLLGYKTRASFDIESSYTVQDINGTNKKSYFSKSVKFNFGNNFKFTKLGDTIIKYRYDIRQFKDSTLDTRTNTLFINQLLTLPNDKIVSVIANADFASVTNTPENNTNTYMLRADYIQKQAFWKGDLQAAFTLLLTDTLENSATRGIEKNFGPEIEFRKGVFKNLEVALQYNYNKNTSDLDANNYDNHVISLEFEISK